MPRSKKKSKTQVHSLSVDEINKLTIPDLKSNLRSLGEKVGGKKADLQKRLKNAIGIPEGFIPATKGPVGKRSKRKSSKKSKSKKKDSKKKNQNLKKKKTTKKKNKTKKKTKKNKKKTQKRKKKKKE
jgi:hypothetical protein